MLLPWLIAIIIFIIALLAIELAFFSYRMIRYPDRAEVRRRLRMSMQDFNEEEAANIYKKSKLSDVPFLNRILPIFPGVEGMRLYMEQANVQYTLGFFILLTMALGMVGFLAGTLFKLQLAASILIAVFLATLPTLSLRRQKNKRMAKFEKQLPDALGLIARALRSGHAFTSGMKLAADEFDDPIGTEFNETLDEINFGVSVAEALKNMTERVDCPDLKFFVVSVILQRETGGNLAEIIEGLAEIIRERFKFRGKLKTLSAEGRLSANILIVLPIFMAVYMFFVAPQVISVLYTDPIGRAMSVIMVVLMIVGYLMMRRIVKVEI